MSRRIIIDREHEFDLYEYVGKVWLAAEDGENRVSMMMTPEQARELAMALTAEADACEKVSGKRGA